MQIICIHICYRKQTWGMLSAVLKGYRRGFNNRTGESKQIPINKWRFVKIQLLKNYVQ